MNNMVSGIDIDKQRALESISRNIKELALELKSINTTLKNIERKLDYNQQTKNIDAIE